MGGDKKRNISFALYIQHARLGAINHTHGEGGLHDYHRSLENRRENRR